MTKRSNAKVRNAGLHSTRLCVFVHACAVVILSIDRRLRATQHEMRSIRVSGSSGIAFSAPCTDKMRVTHDRTVCFLCLRTDYIDRCRIARQNGLPKKWYRESKGTGERKTDG